MKLNNREVRGIVRFYELPLLIGLLATWMALWREISWMTLLSGLVVSTLAVRLFYLPPIQLGGRFNPVWAMRYLMYFLWHLVLASFQVAWLAVRPGPKPRTAIIQARLSTKSDFILTMVGLTVSLIPGSLVVEIDRSNSTLYLHIINTPTQRQISQAKLQVAHIEALLIRAIGSKQELEALK